MPPATNICPIYIYSSFYLYVLNRLASSCLLSAFPCASFSCGIPIQTFFWESRKLVICTHAENALKLNSWNYLTWTIFDAHLNSVSISSIVFCARKFIWQRLLNAVNRALHYTSSSDALEKNEILIRIIILMMSFRISGRMWIRHAQASARTKAERVRNGTFREWGPEFRNIRRICSVGSTCKQAFKRINSSSISRLSTLHAVCGICTLIPLSLNVIIIFIGNIIIHFWMEFKSKCLQEPQAFMHMYIYAGMRAAV